MQGKKEEPNRRQYSGQSWTLPAQLGQLKQDKVERDCFKAIYGVPATLKGYGKE